MSFDKIASSRGLSVSKSILPKVLRFMVASTQGSPKERFYGKSAAEDQLCSLTSMGRSFVSSNITAGCYHQCLCFVDDDDNNNNKRIISLTQIQGTLK